MAISMHKQAIKINPLCLNARKAIIQYQKAIAIKPEYSEALSNLGIIYGKMGLLDQSIQQLRKSLDISPRDPITMFNLALAYEELAKKKEQRAEGKELRVKAIETYRKVLDLEPDNTRAKDRIEKISKKFSNISINRDEYRKLA